MPKTFREILKQTMTIANLKDVNIKVNDLQKASFQTIGKSECLFIMANMYLAFEFLCCVFLALLIISAPLGSDISFLLNSSVHKTLTSFPVWYLLILSQT